MSPKMLLDLGIVLGIMVLVHEFGHFAVAKLCGVRVEIFSIGFGKRLFGFKRGDTDYRISILPLGGYVKMAGDIPGEDPSGDAGEFNAHPRWQRALIALAGPVANFILAIALMVGVFMAHNEVPNFLSGPAITDYVIPNTPAARTGIQSGDTIVHFDGVENPRWEDVGIRESFNLNQTVRFSYLHNGQRVDTTFFVQSKGDPGTDFLSLLGLSERMQDDPMQVATITAGFPAERAGLHEKDRILSINGINIHSLPAMVAYLQSQAGKPATLQILRDGKQIAMQVTPELHDSADGKGYRIGFGAVLPPSHIEHFSFTKALDASLKFNKEKSMLIVEVVKRLFTRQVSMHSLAGPLGIGEQIKQAADEGWTPLIGTMAFISVNLGILNLMPFPILDGGMLVFLLIEGIMRKDVNVQIKERVYQVAFVCLILFAAVIFYNDLSRMAIFTRMKP